MKKEKEEFFSENNKEELRAYELNKNDVISIIPKQPHKRVYKVADNISQIEALRLCGYTAEEKKDFKIVKIDYKKFPWWQFWKRKKYVEKYYLEVM